MLHTWPGERSPLESRFRDFFRAADARVPSTEGSANPSFTRRAGRPSFDSSLSGMIENLHGDGTPAIVGTWAKAGSEVRSNHL